MSLVQFTEFIKKVTTETQEAAKDTSSGSGSVLAAALSGVKDFQGDAEAKVNFVSEKLAEVAKTQGYDVTESDVKTYLDSLKTQYELNPIMASMMDTYCSTTCHIGSAVGTK
jgi:hypothetical protein